MSRRRVRTLTPEQKARKAARRRALWAASPEKYAAQFKARYAAHPERWRAYWIRRYGLTPAQYDSLVARQRGACALCSVRPPYRLLVDHDHSTGRVRGVLCRPCNSTRAGSNTSATVRQLLAYLESDFDGRRL